MLWRPLFIMPLAISLIVEIMIRSSAHSGFGILMLTLRRASADLQDVLFFAVALMVGIAVASHVLIGGGTNENFETNTALNQSQAS